MTNQSLIESCFFNYYYCIRDEEAEDESEAHGHITSLAVMSSHRKLGLATKLMQAARTFPPPPQETFVVYNFAYYRKGND